jgi:hypothetical protein
MAHARRYFFDVYDATKSPVAEEALKRIQELYGKRQPIGAADFG